MLWTTSVRDTVNMPHFIFLIALRADARRHVNKMCMAANVPLVESGTAGYLGQVQPILKVCLPCSRLCRLLINGFRIERSVLIALPSRLLRLSQSVLFAQHPRSPFIALFGPKVISYRKFDP